MSVIFLAKAHRGYESQTVSRADGVTPRLSLSLEKLPKVSE